MKELNNTLNATETTAKITTEEAFDIIAENYEAIQNFEDEYNNFLVDDCKGLDEDVLEKIVICDEDEDLLDSLYGHSLYRGLELVYNKCTDGAILANVGLYSHFISEYVYDIEDLLEGEEDDELSVELRNDVAEWGDNLGDVLDFILEKCKDRLENYLEHRTEIVEAHEKLESYMDDSMEEYNDILDVTKAIDPEKIDDVSIYLWGRVSDIFDIKVSAYNGKAFVDCRFDGYDDEIVDVYDRWVSDSDDLYYQFDDAMNDVRLAFAKVCADNIVRSTLGFRENDVLDNLDKAEVVMNTTDHLVVRFTHIDGEHAFEYDFVTNKVVG